jgi:hypothetical protein
MIPKTETLPCGYKVVPYIYKGKFNFEVSQRDMSMCDAALHMMNTERIDHRLSDNYSRKRLNNSFSKMLMYNFVFDGVEPVFASGAQIDGDTIRVFSRYFGFNKYRTDGTKALDKIDNFDELKYTLKHLDNKLIYWSRDKSPNFFYKLKKGRPDVFNEWYIHPEKLEIIHPDNNQYIFYTGDINLIC